MRPFMAILSLLPVLLLAAPAGAATKAERMATCQFGAEHDKLTGAKRDAFIKKCMAAGNYEPAARMDAMKKPAAAKPAAMAPADDKKQ